ncbi:MAG TPA: hypothetical protein VF459_08055 [Caulobacteraceae bacterium]
MRPAVQQAVRVHPVRGAVAAEVPVQAVGTIAVGQALGADVAARLAAEVAVETTGAARAQAPAAAATTGVS